MKTTSLTDNPRSANTKDDFGITPFELGLIKFIRNTSTPITLALQGEWGSGKTSLMNSLRDELCDKEKSLFYPIWINTWEYALMQDAQSTLVQIITKLVSDTTRIASPDGEKKRELLEKVKKIGFLASKFALNSSVGIGAGDVLNPLFEDEKSSIGALREELQAIINSAIENGNKKGFIFFIDDLDRIDPRVAVELLELLKNIFTLDNSVFILAIDYDVVVKGLKPKFGELTDKNEREFRSFFDKIIQVPFSMPVNSYKIDDFLKQKLFEISYLNLEEMQNRRLIANMSKVANLTVGSNPRAIKRLLNSLSLIKCINDAKNDKLHNASEKDELRLKGELDLYINFALVSIQIAYPKIYGLLNLYPDFTKWNEGIAVQQNLEYLDEEVKQRLSDIAEFDEEWEQVLYRLCDRDYFLKQKALNISELLNTIKNEILSIDNNSTPAKDEFAKIDIVGDHIRRIIRLSAVTHLEANDGQTVHYHASSFLKDVRDALINTLKKQLPQLAETIAPASSRVQTNAPFSLTKDLNINLSSMPYKGKLRLEIKHDCWLCKTSHGSIQKFIETSDKVEEFRAIELEFNTLSLKYSRDKYECYDSQKLMNSIFSYSGWFYFNLRFYVILPNIEDFTKPEILESMAEIVEGIYNTYNVLIKLREAY